MLRSILVPLDGTDFAERSLALANEVAKASGAELHLARVHVPHEPESLMGHPSFQWEGLDMHEYDEKQRRRERTYLDEVEEKLDHGETPVDMAVLGAGPVVDELAEYAERTHADMIFIASHAYGGLKRAWRGSIADGILHKSGVPLLVVHPSPEDLDGEPVSRLTHLLVPLDGSPLAEGVLAPAVDLATATGARVTLLRVLTPMTLGPRLLPVEPEKAQTDEEMALEYLEEVAEGLRGRGLEVATRVEQGNHAAPTIADVADECGADLIALATHGFGGLKRTLVGSVADKLLHTTKLPVLLRRPPLEV